MSLEDPFFVVKEEVSQSLKTAQTLYTQWSAQIEQPGGSADNVQLQTTTTELKSCLKSIEWDLQDLGQTITIAENNQHKFRIDVGELEQRKQFVRNTTATVEKIRTHLNSDATKAKLEAHQRKTLLGSSSRKAPQGRYRKLDDEMERSNQGFIEQQHNQQQTMMVKQDEQLEDVGQSVQTLKRMGVAIGDELDEQAVILEDFDRELEHTDSRLRTLTKRVELAIKKTSGRAQLCCIVILVLLLIVVVVLFAVPF
ncbi:syntaxin-6-like [Dysidea avara]|uniref:syntaxin-6-like n=1 Tax=Dysidea avara TaxID=196820 RepID=UPI003325CC17